MTMGDEAPVMPCPNEERLRLALEGAQLGLWDGNHPSGEIYWGARGIAAPERWHPGVRLWLHA